MTGNIVLLTTVVTVLGDALNGEPAQSHFTLNAFSSDELSADAARHLQQFEGFGKLLANQETLDDLLKIVRHELTNWKGVTYQEHIQQITI